MHRKHTPSRSWLVPVALVAGLMLLPDTTLAQRGPSGAIGLGGQIGSPAGVTLKFREPSAVSYDFMAAWDADDFFFLNVHALFERPIGRHGGVHFFYGPGAFIGLRDGRRNHNDESVFGISATVGLGVLLEQFELFGQLTPRLDLVPATDSDIGVGIGVRYYF